MPKFSRSTQFTINPDPQKAVDGLVGRCNVLLVDYRAATHPVTGSTLTQERSEQIENYLGGVIYTEAKGHGRALRLTAWSYAIIMPTASRSKAQVRFSRLVRTLSKCMLTPTSTGWLKGAHFWGSCSSTEVSSSDLIGAATEDSGTDLSSWIARIGERPFATSTFYRSPRSIVLGGDDSDPLDVPPLSAAAVVAGSYSDSRRMRLTDESHFPTLLEVPAHATWPKTEHVCLDVWGSWAEAVRFPNSNAVPQAGHLVEEWVGLTRDLEPLIRDLWLRIDSLDQKHEDQANQIHMGLLDLSSALRDQDRSRLRVALNLILAAIGSILAGVASNVIWHHHGETISDFLSRI